MTRLLEWTAIALAWLTIFTLGYGMLWLAVVVS